MAYDTHTPAALNDASQKATEAVDATTANAAAAEAAPATTATLDPADQLLLFELPTSNDAKPPVASSQPKRSSRRAAGKSRNAAGSSTATAQVDASHAGDKDAADGAKIVFVDPLLVETEPFNGRGLAAFDPDANRELIDDMRTRGNTVPIRLRPKPDGSGWTCPSGSRRVNAGRVIAADDPVFKIAAIVDAAMTDAEAYALCLADNHGRNAVTPMQRGREMKWAIENLHGGDRGAYIRTHGVDASVISRAIGLVDLPEPILDCAEDRETLPTVFAEKLAPRLKDQSDRRAILARVKSLDGARLPTARLLAYLLSGERTARSPDRRTIGFGSGRNRVKATVTIALNGSAMVKVPSSARLSDAQRQELADVLRREIDELVIRTTTDSDAG